MRDNWRLSLLVEKKQAYMEKPRASSPYIRRTSRTQQKERQKTAHTAVPIVKRVDAEKVLDEVDSVGCNYFSISCSKSFLRANL